MQKYTIIGVIGLLVLGGLVFVYFRAEAPRQDATMEEQKTGEIISPTPASSQSGQTQLSPQTQPKQVLSKNFGRVVFAITDESVPLENLTSLLLIVNEISVLSPTKGWVSVSKTPIYYDLVRLYRNPVLEIFADVNLEEGVYNQIRLNIGKSTLTKKDGSQYEVKIPSSELKIVGKLVVVKGSKSAVTIDFLADKSLFLTGSGKYVFLPVLKVDTRSYIENIQIFSGKADFIGGKTDFDATFGSDENGMLKKDFKFDGAAKFEIEGDAIRVLPRQ